MAQNIWIELLSTVVVIFTARTTFRDSESEYFGMVGKRNFVDFLETSPDIKS